LDYCEITIFVWEGHRGLELIKLTMKQLFSSPGEFLSWVRVRRPSEHPMHISAKFGSNLFCGFRKKDENVKFP
jgi:hypothetical protein